MRGLITLAFFFVLLFGLGIILIGIVSTPPNPSPNVPFFAFLPSNSSQQPSSTILVDRSDDTTNVDPCTDAPNDCTLRDAIEMANTREGGNATITFASHYMFHVNSPLPSLSAPGTTIKATPEQDVHIDGNNTDGSVLRITGGSINIIGLRIYGSGQNHANIRITDKAQDVIIANCLIGDDDGPAGGCGSSQFSYGGILVDAAGPLEEGKSRAWIYGNIIECHDGNPGDGIIIFTDGVKVGSDKQGNAGGSQRNFIRNNQGWGVNLNNSFGNTISNSELSENTKGPVYITNFNNNWMNNTVK